MTAPPPHEPVVLTDATGDESASLSYEQYPVAPPDSPLPAVWEQPPAATPATASGQARERVARRTRGSGRNLARGVRRSPRAASASWSDRRASRLRGWGDVVFTVVTLGIFVVMWWFAYGDARAGDGAAVPWLVALGVIVVVSLAVAVPGWLRRQRIRRRGDLDR